jgi:F-type H+-transporting ATPase subunit b
MNLVYLASIADVPKQLGVDAPKLIAQIITFLLVYWILSKYAFGPVTGILEARRKRIEDGEANLAKVKQDIANSSTTAAEIRAKAEADATRIVKEAQDAANAVKESRTQEAIAEAASIVSKAREAASMEHDRMLAELKGEVGRLVVGVAGKVTGRVLNDDDKKRINSEALTQLAN